MDRDQIISGFETSKCIGVTNGHNLAYQTITWYPTPIEELWEWNRLGRNGSYQIAFVHGCCANTTQQTADSEVAQHVTAVIYTPTVKHIVAECRLRTFDRGIGEIHAITPEAIECIRDMDVHPRD